MLGITSALTPPDLLIIELRNVQESVQEDARDAVGREVHHHLPKGEQLLRRHRQSVQVRHSKVTEIFSKIFIYTLFPAKKFSLIYKENIFYILSGIGKTRTRICVSSLSLFFPSYFLVLFSLSYCVSSLQIFKSAETTF